MSNPALTIVQGCGPVFDGAMKAVLMALADRTGEDGTCWPSYECISWDASVSRRQVIRLLKKLENMGLVTIDRGGGHKSNTYILNLELLEKISLGLSESKKRERSCGKNSVPNTRDMAKKIKAELEQGLQITVDDPGQIVSSDTASPPKNGNGDAVSPPIDRDSGDSMSPHIVNETVENSEDIGQVSPLRCHGVTPAVTSDVTRTLINPNKPEDSEVETPSGGSTQLRNWRGDLARALRVSVFELMEMAGSPARAEMLARQWNEGVITIEQVNQALNQPALKVVA